jgi:putative membrane-bound dehydrogenase-like protein
MRTLSVPALLLAASAAAAQPVPVKDAAAKMTVPDGFKVTLFAGEPDVVQPIAFTFDDRGRMWVVECLSYPKWAKDGTGKDRVVILEDTDGDGVHDKKTVFLDNGSNLSGIELGFGGVWLCSLPNLIFVPVKDGEDKPAGPPQVLLDGWNLNETKHNVFNSLGWGPDGWLYGCNGIQAKSWVGAPGTPKEKRTYMDCGVWRYHPTRKAFEAVAHGTTNPFGLDWNEDGEMFVTNCVIDHLFHFVPGGHYQRMYGQDANPHTYGLMRSCVDYKHWAGGDWTSSRTTGVGGKPEHSDFGGGHAHSGCAIYLADNFPPEYRGTLFTANIHGNRLNNDGLARTPAGYKGVRRPDFLFANDSWFRGICVKVGPEGGLYVSDWCDTGECHNYDKADTTNGRIYRVVYKTPKAWTGDISKMTDAELVKLQLHSNEWFVRKARRVLQERAAAGTLERLTPDGLRAILNADKDVPRRLRMLWALEVTGHCKATDLANLFTAREDVLRAWAVRLSAEHGDRLDRVAGALLKLGESEKSPFVRVAIASAAARVPLTGAGPGAAGLVQLLERNAGSGDDYHLALMTWYAAARQFADDPAAAVRAVRETTAPLVRRNIVRHLLSQPQPEQVLPDLLLAVNKSDDEGLHLDVLRGIREGLVGKSVVRPGPQWATAYGRLSGSKHPDIRREVTALAVLFGDEAVIADLGKRVADTAAKADDRRAAVELLLTRKQPEFAKTLRGLLDDPAVRRAAVRGLAAFPDADTPAAILKAYPQFTAEEKLDAVQTLASRAAWATALLDAVEKKTLPRSDIPVATARQVLALNDKAVSARLEAVWGKVGSPSKEKVALTKKWKDALTEPVLAKANPAAGRGLFVKHCAACHKMFGDGGEVGPELTGSQRANLDYVLENVLDPSAVVPREFRMINFSTADERVVAGIVLRETKDAVTVRTPTDTVVLPAADVVGRKDTSLSIMPDGLFDQMTPDEVRDLVAYLRAKEQVPK